MGEGGKGGGGGEGHFMGRAVHEGKVGGPQDVFGGRVHRHQQPTGLIHAEHLSGRVRVVHHHHELARDAVIRQSRVLRPARGIPTGLGGCTTPHPMAAQPWQSSHRAAARIEPATLSRSGCSSTVIPAV